MKRIITVMFAAVIMITLLPCAAFASDDILESKAMYYTEESDYISGDCILTATRMMIRRAAAMRGKDGWKNILNETLRPVATVDGCLLSSFTFESEGLVYHVSFGEFSGGDDAARIKEIESLLEKHPEGIVVHGDWAASTGTHGVLAVAVKGGELYAVDASYNMGIFSEGIQKWSETTMLEPSLSTRYWYISDVSEAEWRPDLGIDRRMYFNMLRCA